MRESMGLSQNRFLLLLQPGPSLAPTRLCLLSPNGYGSAPPPLAGRRQVSSLSEFLLEKGSPHSQSLQGGHEWP